VTGLSFKAVDKLATVPQAVWDGLVDEAASPFLRHAWLSSLEEAGCASPGNDWVPTHLTLWKGRNLVAAAPAYVKEDSDGDFARDWDLASAVTRSRISYYPKLAITVPFTPCTGRRILTAPGEDRASLIAQLLDGARVLMHERHVQSLQVLFPLASEAAELEAAGMPLRISFQYHWQNAGYADVEAFLARLSSKRRNTVRREMAAPARQGITLRTVRGDELHAGRARWAKDAFALHRSTIDKLPWGRGWLNQAFYARVLESMPENVEVVAAEKDGRLIAGAFNVASPTHLYGRYWGCFEEHPFLHFNVCLYHSVGECIRRGVKVFEGGAGGEHKLSRGFEPATTFTAHAWLDARLHKAFASHLRDEVESRRHALARFATEHAVLKPFSSEEAAE
jgi:predicted N-acyltransferase